MSYHDTLVVTDDTETNHIAAETQQIGTFPRGRYKSRTGLRSKPLSPFTLPPSLFLGECASCFLCFATQLNICCRSRSFVVGLRPLLFHVLSQAGFVYSLRRYFISMRYSTSILALAAPLAAFAAPARFYGKRSDTDILVLSSSCSFVV